MTIIITLLVCGLSATGGLFYVLRQFSKQHTAGSGETIGLLEKKADELEKSTKAAIEYINTLVPLADALAKEKELQQARSDLDAEVKRLTELDARLTKLQLSVDEAETQHNQVKRGKEGADTLADEIKAKKDQLTEEVASLENQLQQSKSLLTDLEKESGVNANQVATLQSIGASLEKSLEQLRAVSESYTMNSSRFVNLENQFSELEQEFTKIVAREIGGD